MCPQLFFSVILKPPFAAPSGALNAQIYELGLKVGANLERRGTAARRGRRGGADRFEISGQQTAFFVSPPRASKFGALCHASAPTPSAAARAPAAASMVARAGALILQG